MGNVQSLRNLSNKARPIYRYAITKRDIDALHDLCRKNNPYDWDSTKARPFDVIKWERWRSELPYPSLDASGVRIRWNKLIANGEMLYQYGIDTLDCITCPMPNIKDCSNMVFDYEDEYEEI